MGDYVDCELISTDSEGRIRLFNKAIVESQGRETSQKSVLKLLGMQRRNERPV
jgi:hypothetical protein